MKSVEKTKWKSQGLGYITESDKLFLYSFDLYFILYILFYRVHFPTKSRLAFKSN